MRHGKPALAEGYWEEAAWLEEIGVGDLIRLQHRPGTVVRVLRLREDHGLISFIGVDAEDGDPFAYTGWPFEGVFRIKPLPNGPPASRSQP